MPLQSAAVCCEHGFGRLLQPLTGQDLQPTQHLAGAPVAFLAENHRKPSENGPFEALCKLFSSILAPHRASSRSAASVSGWCAQISSPPSPPSAGSRPTSLSFMISSTYRPRDGGPPASPTGLLSPQCAVAGRTCPSCSPCPPS